jgi:formate hydrogenlyase subunit 3/multisubunit Na+/H+ antiporter MnhD subunit
MSFEEKVAWVGGFVAVIVGAVYASVVLPQVGSAPASAIAYQSPMLIAIGAMIVMTIIGTILMSIGTAISAEITGNGSVDDIDRKDERDVDINRRGELMGYYVSSVGLVGALALAMMRYDHFWIANAIFASFMVASVVSAAVKVLIYRRGF